MTNGKRNRTAGHALERKIVNKLKTIGFPHAVTARSESKARDDLGVDIMNTNEAVNGRLLYNIQAKNTTTSLAYPKILAAMPKDKQLNVIIHNQTKRSNKRFITKGQYAIMELDSFYSLIERIEKLKDIVNTYFDNHTLKEQQEINEILQKLKL